MRFEDSSLYSSIMLFFKKSVCSRFESAMRMRSPFYSTSEKRFETIEDLLRDLSYDKILTVVDGYEPRVIF